MIFLLFLVLQVNAELMRLDPHGVANKNIHAEGAYSSNCSICHTQDKTGIKVKVNAAGTCQGCHNSTPHSGVAEHMTRVFHNSATNTNETVTCMSCHSPHRFGSLDMPGESHLIHTVKDVKAPLLFKNSKAPMLKRRCEDCHKW